MFLWLNFSPPRTVQYCAKEAVWVSFLCMCEWEGRKKSNSDWFGSYLCHALSSDVYTQSCFRHGLRHCWELWSPASSAFQPSSFNWLQILCVGERGVGTGSAYGRLQMSMNKEKRTTLLSILCRVCKKYPVEGEQPNLCHLSWAFPSTLSQTILPDGALGSIRGREGVEVRKFGNGSWPKPLSIWKMKLCSPSLLCWLGAHVLPSEVRADLHHHHCCSGGFCVLFLFSTEAGQFLLSVWQILNSLTKDVSEGRKLLTDFTWISWLDSVLKNDGIMFTGLNRKSSLDSYLPCSLFRDSPQGQATFSFMQRKCEYSGHRPKAGIHFGINGF